ncbi:MAG: hypothetical protein ACREKM_08790, partial [Longimicrobiales bacterium]
MGAFTMARSIRAAVHLFVFPPAILLAAIRPAPLQAQVVVEEEDAAAPPTVRAYADVETTDAGSRSVAAFEVLNVGGEAQTVDLACFVDGNVSECSLAQDSVMVQPGSGAKVMVRYTADVAGSGRVVLRVSNAAGSSTASMDVQVTGDMEGSLSAAAFEMGAIAAGGVDVWFLDDTVTADANMPDGVEFLMVKNTSTSPQNVSLSCTRTGAVSTCSIVPSSVYLDGQEQIDVSVEFTTGSAGVGSMIALGGGDRDTLTVLVGSGTPAAPIVTSSVLNPGKLHERSACVTSGAGPAGAFQCGELLVAHAMPAYRTMNRERSLTLLYNSATAKPTPVIAADVSLGAQTMVPQSLSVALYVGGTLRKSVSYSVSGLTAGGGARRIAIPFDATSDATGIYPYSLTVTNQYGGSSHSTTAAGEVIIVNRNASPYGAGWWVAGVEQLVMSDGLGAGGRVVVGADGSGAYYSSVVAGKWVAPAGEYRDTLYQGSFPIPGGTSSYRRILLNGTEIHYDASGRQIWVEDRDGNGVGYGWASADRLSVIRISPYAQNKIYSFLYDG